MSAIIQTQPTVSLRRRLPLLHLLDPREYLRPSLIALGVGMTIALAARTLWSAPLWTFTFIVLLTLLPVGVRKWRDDLHRYGGVIMVLSILVIAQGVHTIEHIIQWGQYHILYWTMRQSSGLVSAANAEWVHFTWNWAVLIAIVILIKGGMRNIWGFLLLWIATAHTLEHTYLFLRYLEVLGELRSMGVTTVTAQGLPGIFGRDGWLARSLYTSGTPLGSLPWLTTVVRLDVHFWWNMIETALVLLAGHVLLRRTPRFYKSL